MIITENEMKEIEGLIPEHCGALVKYGADLYRQGIYAGMLYLTVFIGVINISTIVYRKVKSKSKNTEKQKSES